MISQETRGGCSDHVEDYSPAFRNMQEEAYSLDHLMDHYPKNPHCHACQVGKIQPQQSRRPKGLGPPPTQFGEQVTADHILSRSDRSEGITGDLDSLLIYDRATTWIDWVTTPGQENPKISSRLQQLHLVENIQTKMVVLPTLRQTECQIFPMTHML